MLTHRGFSAWIVVNGQPLPEYLVAVNSETNQVSCWISSEEGQEFSVHWEDHGGNIDTCAFISLDGFIAPGRFLFGHGRTFRSGVRTSQTTERPFVFRRVADGASNPMSPSSRDAGMIVLKIKRVNRVASRPVDNFQQLAQGPQGTRQSGDIYVGFGEDGPAQERWNYTWGVEPHAEDGPGGATPSTYVSFTFRYRTYEFLQAQGIAQAPPPVRGPSSATRAPVRRISSAPAVSHNESSVATPGSIHRVQRYAHELSAGVPSQMSRPALEARRTASWVPTISLPVNSPLAGQHVLVPPRGPPEDYHNVNYDTNHGTVNHYNTNQQNPNHYNTNHQNSTHDQQ